jgi:polysaccharide biosynthesis transport protein
VRQDSPFVVIWRRKTIIIVTLLVFAAAAAAVSKSLDKVYAAESKLLIALPSDLQSFTTVQASQDVARSYGEVIKSTNLANLVAQRMGGGFDADSVAEATTFEPLRETQLLEIRAEDPDPATARRLANTYAQVFTDYATQRLAPTTKARVSLADAAPLPDDPVRPRPTLYTLLAAFVGLALGLLLAFIRERLDRRLRTPEEVEALFEPPVIGRIPRRARTQSSAAMVTESFRLLRTNLRFSGLGGEPRSLAVTSGREAEGKTTVVTQLALVSAEAGLNVVVIDGDLRRPGLEKSVVAEFSEPLSPGLSNYLVEAASLDEVVHSSGKANISILPPGPLPPSPATLLQTDRAQRLVPALLERADLVLVDCPPLNVAADASLISGWVEGVLFVVDLQTSDHVSVRDGLRQLEAVHASVTGLILNRDRTAESDSYAYYVARDRAAGDGRGARRGDRVGA